MALLIAAGALLLAVLLVISGATWLNRYGFVHFPLGFNLAARVVTVMPEQYEVKIIDRPWRVSVPREWVMADNPSPRPRIVSA